MTTERCRLGRDLRLAVDARDNTIRSSRGAVAVTVSPSSAGWATITRARDFREWLKLTLAQPSTRRKLSKFYADAPG